MRNVERLRECGQLLRQRRVGVFLDEHDAMVAGLGQPGVERQPRQDWSACLTRDACKVALRHERPHGVASAAVETYHVLDDPDNRGRGMFGDFEYASDSSH